MREHTRHESGTHDIHAAWLIVPMSVGAAVLMAIGSLAIEPASPTPLQATGPQIQQVRQVQAMHPMHPAQRAPLQPQSETATEVDHGPAF